jgi:hypothetical protein
VNRDGRPPPPSGFLCGLHPAVGGIARAVLARSSGALWLVKPSVRNHLRFTFSSFVVDASIGRGSTSERSTYYGVRGQPSNDPGWSAVAGGASRRRRGLRDFWGRIVDAQCVGEEGICAIDPDMGG